MRTAETCGSASLEVGLTRGTSFVASLRSTSPLRLLAPVTRGKSVWVYTSSFGGGFVGGDETRLDVRLAAGTRCFVGSQSASKVYRNPDSRPCGHVTRAEVGADALLAYLPDPVQPFAEARYRQQQEFHLAAGAGLVLGDAFTAGRVARDERWAFQRFTSRNEVFVEGRRWFLDVLSLQPGDGPLGGAARLGRFNHVALLLLLGPPAAALVPLWEARVAETPVLRRSPLVVSGGPVAGGFLVRVAAERGEEALHWVRECLRPLAGLLGDDPWVRKW